MKKLKKLLNIIKTFDKEATWEDASMDGSDLFQGKIVDVFMTTQNFQIEIWLPNEDEMTQTISIILIEFDRHHNYIRCAVNRPTINYKKWLIKILKNPSKAMDSTRHEPWTQQDMIEYYEACHTIRY